MPGKRFVLRLKAALTILSLIILVNSTWAADQEKVLHSFDPGLGANYPLSALIIAGSSQWRIMVAVGDRIDGWWGQPAAT